MPKDLKCYSCDTIWGCEYCKSKEYDSQFDVNMCDKCLKVFFISSFYQYDWICKKCQDNK